jgi:hypothetical protein
MDRGGALPERCIVCNADASHRLTRTLYSSPLGWRISAFAAPFVLLGIGAATNTPLLRGLAMPLGLVLLIVHTFVRKKIELELGMCRRHRRTRMALGLAAFGCMAAIPFSALNSDFGFSLLVVVLLALTALAIAWSFTGAQAVTLDRMSDDHLWLARTGKRFRLALPELPAKP